MLRRTPRVDLVSTFRLLFPREVYGRVAVVIDVLRATTTIVSALSGGALRVIPVTSMAPGDRPSNPGEPEALAGVSAGAAAPLAGDRPVIGGERNDLKPAGYDLGNSPAEIQRSQLKGRTLLLCTTNGTQAILRARSARSLFIGALVNATATARAMQAERLRLREGGGQPIDVLLICAGRRGGRSLALEDMVCAGALCHELLAGDGDLEASDGAQLARELFLGHRADLLGLLKSCQSGKNLVGLGQAADVELSAQLDSQPLVCRWDGRSVVVGR